MSISEQLGELRAADLPQGRISYRERGHGEPLVFVHGVLVNGDLWRGVVPRLAEDYRCITPDWPLGAHSEPMHPGADLSTPGLARLVADFLDALSLENVTLVGNDTGGAVCQLVVTEHPRRVSRLVLTSCDAFEVFPPTPFSFLRWIGRIPAAPALVSHSLKLRPLRRLPIAFGWVTSNPLPREISDSYVAPGYRADIRRDTKRLLNGITNRDTLRAAERFGEVDMPVLVAWADEDKLFPQELADRLAAAFPNARRETIVGSRTFIGEDQPDQLAEAIGGFMADTPLPHAITYIGSMDRLTVYEKPTCTTCRSLAALLEERGVDFETVDYHVEGISEERLRELLAKAGVPARGVLRTKEPLVAKLGLADPGVGEDELIAAMARAMSSSARSVRSMCVTPASPPRARPCTYGRPMTTASAPRASAR